MSKMRTLLVATVLALSMTSPIHAGLRYTIVTDIVREDNKVQKERLVEQVTVDGDKARIDFLAPDGSKPKNGGFILTLDGGKTFALSEGGEAVCADWSTEEFVKTIGALLDKGTRFVNADLEDMKFETTKEEAGPEMLGYPTTHLNLVTGLSLKGRILFKKFEYRADVTDEVWMTTELELPAHEREWLDATAETGFQDIDKLMAAWNKEVSGVVLKQKSVTALTNLDSNEKSTRTETIEVTKLETLESGQIPEGTFAMPECKQVDKKEMEETAKRFIKRSVK